MRWSIIRVIWLRELRDQLRDRRTLFMIVVLPLLVYPVAGLGLMQLAAGVLNRQSVVAILGAEALPLPPVPDEQGKTPPLPVLLETVNSTQRFAARWFRDPREQTSLQVLAYRNEGSKAEDELLADARKLVESREVDLVLVVEPNFRRSLEDGKLPSVKIVSRSDSGSQMAKARVFGVLLPWKETIKQVRFLRMGLPANFAEPFYLQDASAEQLTGQPQENALLDLLLRIFPFVLVLWSLAGALYPAVDLCAGEKERGTMETLLISPAQREEIVWGKFLAIWVFSGATALLNLASMGLTSLMFGGQYASGSVSPIGVAWCIILLLPLSAFFSALCLAVGAYARSSKEGQYYLMPLFLMAMPLLFLTLAPGVELNPFYSMVPITGVALLLQKLMRVGTADSSTWLYFIPVLVPMVVYGWLALRWAIAQFQREDVLFREAERLEIGLWIKHLLREKDPRPSAGQALFCFTIILGLVWFSMGMGSELISTNMIRLIAFVATPTLLMAIVLTTQPRQSLALRSPPLWSGPIAVLLALSLTPPLTELTLFLLDLNPNLTALAQQYRPLTEWLRSLRLESSGEVRWWQAMLVFAVLPAVCEELTFRGFILTGLQRRFRPRTAVLLSSFLFALLHLNVFTFIPTFLLGLLLASLTSRCGSVLPAMLVHVLYNLLLLASAVYWPSEGPLVLLGMEQQVRQIVALGCLVVLVGLLWWLQRQSPHNAYVVFLGSDPGMESPLAAESRTLATPS